MKKKVFFVGIFLSASLLFLSGLNDNIPGQEEFEYDFLVKNARIFDGSLKPAFKADIAVKNGIIVKVEKSIKGGADKIINADKLYIAPGFIDLQCNGAVGADLTGDPGRLLDVAAALPRFGVTSFLPTSVTASFETAKRIPDVLLEQLAGPVLFTQAVRTLVSAGIDTFVELGPGQVLSGLIKRCDRSVTTLSVGDRAGLAKLDAVLGARA